MQNILKMKKEIKKIYIFLGYVVSLIGGFVGIAVSIYFIFGNYSKYVKRNGYIMLLISILSSLIWIYVYRFL